MTSKRSEKIRLTINRLRLCSSPASESIFLNRIFSSVVSLKLYRWIRGSVAVGRPVLFLAVVIVSVVKVAWLGSATRPRRASTFVCRKTFRHTKVQLAVSLQKQKSAAEIFLWKLWKTSEAASEDGPFPVAILQPCGRQNKPSVRTGAVVSGH